MYKIPVREFMTADTTAVDGDTLLTELVKLFEQRRVRSLPVTDADGRVLGVVSETDLFLKEKGVPFSMEKVPTLLGRAIDPDEVDHFARCKRVKVAEVLTRRVVAIDEETTLEDVTMLMFRNRLSMLPVTRDGKLVGVVRRIDLLRQIYGR